MKIERKIQKLSIDLQLEGMPTVTFTTEAVEIKLHGSSQKEIDEKTEKLRAKIVQNLEVIFRKMTDISEND